MKRRIITGTLLVTLIAVLTLGLPLMLLGWRDIASDAQDRLQDETQSVAAAVEPRIDAHEVISADRLGLLLPRARLTVRTPTGEVVAGRQPSGRTRSVTVVFGSATVTASVPKSSERDQEIALALKVVGLGATAVAAAVLLAWRLSVRLARPLADVANRADALGRGTFPAAPLRSGIPEIDAIAVQLERSATHVGTLLELRRDFAADAAHQLRTPLTGIALRLEEICNVGDEDVRREGLAALEQVERLEGTIASLLVRARGDAGPGEDVGLDALAEDFVEAWKPLCASHGRELICVAEHGTWARARHDHVRNILTSLVDNAMQHGAGRITVSVGREDAHVVLRVRDEGRGIPMSARDSIFRRNVTTGSGSGIGLALAHSLAAADGGTLVVSPDDPAELVLVLPRPVSRRAALEEIREESVTNS